jgi:glycosyltransferase involved in cell wall biosynthesis
VLESIVLKKFVISSNCPTGPREILLNGKGGYLFTVGNYIELSKKINYFYKNKKDCKKILNRAYAKLYRFDQKENLKKYLDLINSTINK